MLNYNNYNIIAIPAYDDWSPVWETPTSSLVRKHFFEQQQQQQPNQIPVEKKNYFDFKEEEKIIELTPLQEMNTLLGFEDEMTENNFSDTSVVPTIKNEEEGENSFQISELNDYLNEDIQFEEDIHSSDSTNQTPTSTPTPGNSSFSEEFSTLRSDPLQYEEFITLPNDLQSPPQSNDQEPNQKSKIETVLDGKIIKKKPGRKPQVLTAKQREEKGKLRQMKNREAAKRCREKKSQYLEDLEVQLEALKKENQELKQRLQNFENSQTQTQ
mgnify:CR=1 FL=1